MSTPSNPPQDSQPVSANRQPNAPGNPVYVHVVNFAEVNAKLDEVKDQLSTDLQAIDATLQTTVTDAVNAVNTTLQTTIEDSLQAIEDQIAALEASGDANSAAEIAALQACCDTLEAAIAALQAANDQSGDDIVTAIQAQQAALEAALDALQAANDQSGDDIVAAIQAAQAALEVSLQAVQDQIETEGDETQAAIATQQAAITAAIAALQASNEGNFATLIADLGTTRTDLLAALASLEASNEDSRDQVIAAIAALQASNETDFAATIAAIQDSRDVVEAAIQALQAANDQSGDDIVAAIQAHQSSMETQAEAIRNEVEVQGDETQAAIAALEATLTSCCTTLSTGLDDIETAITTEGDETQALLQELIDAQTAGQRKVQVWDDENTHHAIVNHFGALASMPWHRVVGGSFGGAALDTTRWEQTLVGGGSVTVSDGVLTLTTGTSNGDRARVQSIDVTRFISNQVSFMQTGVRLDTVPTPANQRFRWGLYDETGQNGFFLELLNGILSAVTVKSGTETSRVVSTSWNGNDAFSIGTTNTTYWISYSAGRILWMRNTGNGHELLHAQSAGADNILFADIDRTWRIYYEVINQGAVTGPASLIVRGTGQNVMGIGEFIQAENVARDIDDETLLQGVAALLIGEKDLGGGYAGVNVHHDAKGTSVIVAQGHRLGQIFGRTAQSITIDSFSGDGSLFTLPAGKVFYCTGYAWTMENSSTTSQGKAIIRNGNGGARRIPIVANEASSLGGTEVASGSGSFPDQPLPFTSNPYFDAISGSITVEGILIGYLEDA